MTASRRPSRRPESIVFTDINLPKPVRLRQAFLCLKFRPTMDHNEMHAHTAFYKDVETIEIVRGALYVITWVNPAGRHGTRVRPGQYLVRNQWLREELALEAPVYMVYDDVADLILGFGHTRNRYTYATLPLTAALDAGAGALMGMAYTGLNPPVMRSARYDVCRYPIPADEALLDALCTLFDMAEPKPNVRRLPLMGVAVQDRARERADQVGNTLLTIENSIMVIMHRVKQIIDRLQLTKNIVTNRLATHEDRMKFREWADELRDEARDLRQLIVDRPFVRVAGHTANDLEFVATAFCDAAEHHRAVSNPALIRLRTIAQIIDFVSAAFQQGLAIRLALIPFVDGQREFTEEDRRETVAALNAFVRLTGMYPSLKFDLAGRGGDVVDAFRNGAQDALNVLEHDRRDPQLAYGYVAGPMRRKL